MYFRPFSGVQVGWWLWLMGCQTFAPVAGHYRMYQQADVPTTRGRVLASARSPAALTDGQPADQEPSDTIINFGLGVGLETPLIDGLLQRLIRRKQLLLAAASAGYPSFGGYPGTGWGGPGPGYYPNPAVGYPYGGGGGGGVPWAQPPAYPYPYVPPVDPYTGLGLGGVGLGGVGGGGVGQGGWGGSGVGLGGWGGFNPLFNLDDFGWRNRPQQQQQYDQEQQQRQQQQQYFQPQQQRQ